MRLKSRAVRIKEFGSPSVLKIEDEMVDEPGIGEIRIQHTVAGLNFIDIYQRKGLLKAITGQPPMILGMEGSGVVESVGDDVVSFKKGDRVTHCMNRGTYSDFMIVSEKRVVKIPDGISDEIAAASTLQGLTAQYLLHASWQLEPGQTVLVQAAAGGVGIFLCQWAKYIGATVLGTVSSQEKADFAAENGCDHPILYTQVDFEQKVKDITDGRGVDLVVDAVGKDTVEKGLACLAERGRLVSYGMSSGPMEPVNVNLLRARSASVAAAGLMTYTKNPTELRERADSLFGMLKSGNLIAHIKQTLPIEQVVKGHEDLEKRRTLGSTIFTL